MSDDDRDPDPTTDPADDDATDIPDDPDDADAPLDDLAREIRERRASGTDDVDIEDADDVEDLFESVDMAEVDSESVWEAFAEGDTEGTGAAGLGIGTEVESVETDEEAVAPEGEAGTAGSDHVVPKAEFCQRCPHFSTPPETACTHEGTTIVEVVDSDNFRVRNCPIVEEQREDEFVSVE